MNEGHKHHVELLESGEDAPEALEPAKQTLGLVAPLVPLTVHQHMNRPAGLAQPLQECAAFGRIVRLARRP